MKLGIKVVPSASKSGVVGWLGEDLKVRIAAPANDGKANEALCAFLAEWLGVGRREVTICSGASSRRKIVEIGGVGIETIRARLNPKAVS